MDTGDGGTSLTAASTKPGKSFPTLPEPLQGAERRVQALTSLHYPRKLCTDICCCCHPSGIISGSADYHVLRGEVSELWTPSQVHTMYADTRHHCYLSPQTGFSSTPSCTRRVNCHTCLPCADCITYLCLLLQTSHLLYVFTSPNQTQNQIGLSPL